MPISPPYLLTLKHPHTPQPGDDCDLVMELHETDVLAEGGSGAQSRLIAWLRQPWSQIPADRTGRQEAVQGAMLLGSEGQGECKGLCCLGRRDRVSQRS